MSEMEGWIGKAIPIYHGLSEREAMMQALIHNGKTPPDDEWDLKDEFYDLENYEWIDGQMYRLEAKKLDPYGFIEGTANDDGSVDFVLYWYNGGGGRNEVLEQAIKEAHEREDTTSE